MPRKLLCLPIELYKREIDTRLFLALEAAERGYEVLLGRWQDQVFKTVQDAVFFMSPGTGDTAYDLVKKIKQNNNVVIFHDEEGLIRQSDESYRQFRIGRTAIEFGDYHLAWTDGQAELLRARDCRNVIVAGSIKLDLMRSAANLPGIAADQININTRFGPINPLGGISTEEFIERQVAKGAFGRDEMPLVRDFVEKDRVVFGQFADLIDRLGRVGRHDVSIRVHPAEDRDAYRKLANGFPNITVEGDLSLIESLARSAIVVHDGCTTALEAKAMGKRVVALRPPSVGEYYPSIANTVSDRTFGTAEELFAWLEADADLEGKSATFPDTLLGVRIAPSGKGFVETVIDIADRHPSASGFDTRIGRLKAIRLVSKGSWRAVKYRIRSWIAARRSLEYQERFRSKNWKIGKFPRLVSIPQIERRARLVCGCLGYDPKAFEISLVAAQVVALRKR